jgi:hypothetical protein
MSKLILLHSCYVILSLSVLLGQTSRSGPEDLSHAFATVNVDIFTQSQDHWDYNGSVEITTHLKEGAFRSGTSLPSILSMSDQEATRLMGVLENLPEPEISLVSFTAERTKEQVTLDWSAATSEREKRFFVQRSIDGEQWEDIGMLQIPAKESLEDYAYLDNHPRKGSNYYRLKQESVSGKIGYSDPIAVEILSEGTHITHLFPNPILFGASLSFDLKVISPVEVHLVNQAGETIANVYSKTASAGKHQIDINLDGLESGVYECLIEVNGHVSHRRLVK